MGESVGKNISNNFSNKQSQKHLQYAKQSATDALKTAGKIRIQKTAEATRDLIGNKIADKIMKILKTSPNNDSKRNEEELLRSRFRTKTQNY